MIEACAGTDEEFAVLCVDLDGLKEINDVFGHAMGDKLLVEVASRLEDSARGAVVARLSADEFGLIIDGKQPAAGKLLAEQVGEALANEFLIDGKSVRTGCTTGISVFPHNGSDAASLLANAGAALFRAKAKSRGSISVFEPAMDQQIRDRRVLNEDFDRGLALLRRLKALGVRISMDDFGSGYSSLSYLQAFPFDKIKIDRAFVMNLGRNPQSAAFVRAVIDLGHGLEMSIVAEGVETQDQLGFLSEEGCDAVQGYFIGKPLPIGQYAALVGRSVANEVGAERKLASARFGCPVSSPSPVS